MTDLSWEEFVAAAQACGWTTCVATADERGRPHVAVVAPGFEHGAIWFATRPKTRKALNLRQNAQVALHWPVGNPDAPGEVWARGRATVHESLADREGMWESGIMPYDLSGFFGSPENEDHLFVRVEVTTATLLGPDFVKHRWRP